MLETNHPSLVKIGDRLNPCSVLSDKIAQQVTEDAGPVIAKGNFICDGIDADLDDLRSIKNSGKEYILNIQQQEIVRTGITSLKVGFNNVFGYFLEVTNTHKSKVPTDWIRKQTLSTAERYITEELKIYEQKVLGAEEKIQTLEERIFAELIRFAKEYVVTIQQDATLIARLDCLLSMAEAAERNNYTLPTLNDGLAITIKNGRHPVIEHQLEVGDVYVPNDVWTATQLKFL